MAIKYLNSIYCLPLFILLISGIQCNRVTQQNKSRKSPIPIDAKLKYFWPKDTGEGSSIVYYDTGELIRTIEKSRCFCGEFTGIGGEKSETYLNFQMLLKVASDSLWFKLSFSKSPVMRLYAFHALEIKNKKMRDIVKLRLESDTATVVWRNSDEVVYCTVGFYVSISK